MPRGPGGPGLPPWWPDRRGSAPPPWWPQDEPWPPRRRPPWARRGPPTFLVRLGCLTLGIGFAFGVAVTAFLSSLLATGQASALPAVASLLAFAAGLAFAGFVLRRVGRRTRAADRRRRTFLADVAHEFRTPLSVIRGQAEALADGIYPADAEHVAPIVESARTLERLVDDVRTLAQSEAGALELRREAVDLRSLAADAASSLAADARKAGVQLQVRVPDGLPPADADPARVRSVLTNLLANAIRHTPAGGSVTVSATRRGAELETLVEDTGEGIHPDLLPRVFDRFVKGEGSPGSGLGLAIARDLVEAHGGTIEAGPRPGGGTAVRFALPAEKN
jgi:two-component system sensor histidine kinase BaeS